MPLAESILPQAAITAASGIAEPGSIGALEAFGRRRIEVNSWQSQDHYFSLLLAPPSSETREDGAIVISTSEMSMEKIALAAGTVEVELTDAEAEKIMEEFGNDAFPPK